MGLKRLFIGTYIDQSMFDYVYDDIKHEFERATVGKWVEQQNLHITFKFLGDVEESAIPELKKNLAYLLKIFERPLLIKGLNVFPNQNKARIVYANICDHNHILRNKRDEVEQACAKLGFQEDHNPFKSHLTLQRVKSFDDIELKRLLALYKEYEFGMMHNFRIDLIESQLTRSGPIYRAI